MTLVEAAAGAMLLGTLLVTVLLARGRMAVQARRSEDRLEAVRVLDALMEDWWANRDVPAADEGEIADHPGWRWRTSTVPSQQAKELKANVVAVEIFTSPAQDAQAAARLEVFVPLPPDKNKDKNKPAAAPGPPAGGVKP